MALGDGCLRGLSLGGTRFLLLAAVYTPAAGNALQQGLNPEVSGRRRRRQISHETGGVLRGDLC